MAFVGPCCIDRHSTAKTPLNYEMLETARTNDAYVSSSSLGENVNEKPKTDCGTSTLPQTLSPNEHTSVVKVLFKWRKYFILFFTPILFMPLLIAVPSSVRFKFAVVAKPPCKWHLPFTISGYFSGKCIFGLTSQGRRSHSCHRERGH